MRSINNQKTVRPYLDCPKDRAEFTKLIQSGWSETQLAEYYGCTRDTVRKRRLRWNLRSHVLKESEFDMDLIRSMVINGYSREEIADHFNMTPETLMDRFDYNQITISRTLDDGLKGVARIAKGSVVNLTSVDETMIVTRNGWPIGVMVPYSEYMDSEEGDKLKRGGK